MTPEQEKRLERLLRYSFLGILLGGLIVSTVCGLVVRLVLVACSVDILDWRQAVDLFIPLALWFEVSYVLLAFVTRWAVRRSVQDNPESLNGLGWRILGAFLGMAAVLGYMLVGLAAYDGPGGFANAVALFLAGSPITIPITVGAGAIGALFGFALFSGLLALRQKFDDRGG